ncbi:AbrB/MazE/SpoVT family DNA-binding domain-containing protein [Paenibacillus sp. LHD-117]|uniref:AbrB/MazE/SpoVT family DNA-binding domain-containing protein n=1 Tax=Paenibacillus sp. LHD-117 TaxID=3071412 RepID=UPI0027DF9EAE|nr:AbrB/MazE/SpoVT family DNA-binding domain-containing protein [Paenibacillus sp. LHD-117]MDQ6423125.1 AbrB/MazE/SpoVT family DNA-binding domain-containing protein [Paenibacillus sp. LHD-117]
MHQIPVKLGEGGRVVIPADVRKALGIEVGDELMLHMENGKIILMTRKQAIQYVQEQMSQYQIGDRVLSEELLEERKGEADS